MWCQWHCHMCDGWGGTTVKCANFNCKRGSRAHMIPTEEPNPWLPVHRQYWVPIHVTKLCASQFVERIPHELCSNIQNVSSINPRPIRHQHQRRRGFMLIRSVLDVAYSDGFLTVTFLKYATTKLHLRVPMRRGSWNSPHSLRSVLLKSALYWGKISSQ